MDNSRLTQMTRTRSSRPARWVLHNAALWNRTVLHHGRGKAVVDSEILYEAGAHVSEYDPNVDEIADTTVLHREYDIVMSNFVLNVLPRDARVVVYNQILRAVKPGGAAYIAVRTDKVNGTPFQDGVVTSRGTFQTQLSVSDWTDYFYREPVHVESGFAIFAIDCTD